jgi:hypothetical protein
MQHYINLIDSRISRGLNREAGYEIHHIIPKCLGGEDDSYNLVKLTYKEHYLAHYLLIKIFPEHTAIIYAFGAMSFNKTNMSSRQFSIVKNSIRKNMVENNPMKRQEVKDRLSKSRKEKFLSGQLIPRELTVTERKMHSDRMKKDNPMSKEPWKNHTASPIRVHYEDGTIREFKYLKEVSILTNVPYGTLKYASRKSIGSPKWGIRKIEKI